MQKESARLHVAKNTCNQNRMQKRKGAMTFHCQKCHATAAKCKKKKLNDSCCQKPHAIEAKSEKKELSDFTLPRKESNWGKKKKKI
jgi:hypothetical protein